MTFALFILYVVASRTSIQVKSLRRWRLDGVAASITVLAGLTAAIASLFMRRGGLLANLQLWALIVFAAVWAVADGRGSLAGRSDPGHAAIRPLSDDLRSRDLRRDVAGSAAHRRRLRDRADDDTHATGRRRLPFRLQHADVFDGTRRKERRPGCRTAQGEDQADPDLVDQVSDDIRKHADNAEHNVEWEQPRIRGLGLMHDPNDLALGMIVALGLIGGALKARMPTPRLRNLLLAAAAGALVYGIYLTRSRGGALALVVVLWRFAARRVGRIPALVLLVALGAGALALDLAGVRCRFSPMNRRPSDWLPGPRASRCSKRNRFWAWVTASFSITTR